LRRLYILLVSAVLATTLIAVASSTGASAAPTQQKEQFGAQAFARSVAREGEAFAFSKRDAKTNALANCQARASQSNSYLQDCQGAVWVRNGWMAVAWQESAGGSPSTPAWGSGWAPRVMLLYLTPRGFANSRGARHANSTARVGRPPLTRLRRQEAEPGNSVMTVGDEESSST
jgi:hypothetical protein